MERTIRLLIIDDSEDDAFLLTRHLRKEEFDAIIERVDNAEAMRAAIGVADWDVAFCDMRMPGFDPISALEILTECAPEVPFVVMSGVVAEDRLVQTIQAGAYDFLRKDNLTRLTAIIERALQEKDIRQEKRAVEFLLDESESRFRSLVETMPDSIVVYDETGHIIFANEKKKDILRLPDDNNLLGKHFESFVHPDDVFEVAARFEHVMKTGKPVSAAQHIRIAFDGTSIPVEASTARIQWSGRPAFMAVLRDVSRRYEIISQVRQSEARATAIMQNVADGVIIIDENGTIMTFNRSAESMFGYASDEVIGRSIECLMPDEIAHHHQSFMTRYFSSGVGRIIGQGGRELPGKHRDGTVFPTEATISEAIVDGDRIFIGALRDITRRKTDEKALRESEERFRWAFETAPHGMALVAPDGRWVQVNKALCDFIGYSREELLALDFQTITHPDDLDADLDLVRRVLNGEIATFQLEKRYIQKNGGVVWILLSVALVRDSEGAPIHFISQILDLTARKHAEEEQARLESELRHAQKMESVGTLSGGIAHEFNNMLLPVAGLLELSLDGVEDRPDVRENLLLALENANRASALVDKILSFSRIDNCELVETNIASAIENAVVLLQATIPSTVDISKNLDDIGEASLDRTQISQIVMNLGVNAMHAIGTGVGRIEFKLKKETVTKRRKTTTGQLLPGEFARLSITDTGSGMDEATIKRIFEPFFTTKAVGEGTGMGLAFVHGVIIKHGGMIDVKSQPGNGTAFHIFIPFGNAAQQTNAVAAAE